MQKSPRKFYAPDFFRTNSGLCIYHLFIGRNFSCMFNCTIPSGSPSLAAIVLLFLLRFFTAFMYNAINCYLSITTYATLAILFRIINLCIDVFTFMALYFLSINIIIITILVCFPCLRAHQPSWVI